MNTQRQALIDIGVTFDPEIYKAELRVAANVLGLETTEEEFDELAILEAKFWPPFCIELSHPTIPA